MEQDFIQFDLSRANIAYRALIAVGLAILLDVDPECILRVLLCNFLQWLTINELQRLCHAISNGGPCKHTAEVRRIILQRSSTAFTYPWCVHTKQYNQIG